MSEEIKAPEAPAQEQIATDKAQILWDGNTLVVILPLEKLSRPMARGLLREAEDMVCIRHLEMDRAKKKIIAPSTIQGKLAKIFKH